jgi:hypothetical protein
MVGLIAPHGIFTALAPGSSRFAGQIMFADQGFLNGLYSIGINLLLAAQRLFLALTGCGKRSAMPAFR